MEDALQEATHDYFDQFLEDGEFGILGREGSRTSTSLAAIYIAEADEAALPFFETIVGLSA